ncbi:MAG: hypothetical protein Q9161_002906 [Pseudevernia consocians]
MTLRLQTGSRISDREHESLSYVHWIQSRHKGFDAKESALREAGLHGAGGGKDAKGETLQRAEKNDAFDGDEFEYDGVGGEEGAQMSIESKKTEEGDSDRYCVNDGQL